MLDAQNDFVAILKSRLNAVPISALKSRTCLRHPMLRKAQLLSVLLFWSHFYGSDGEHILLLDYFTDTRDPDLPNFTL
jgi:hypothetical protein